MLNHISGKCICTRGLPFIFSELPWPRPSGIFALCVSLLGHSPPPLITAVIFPPQTDKVVPKHQSLQGSPGSACFTSVCSPTAPLTHTETSGRLYLTRSQGTRPDSMCRVWGSWSHVSIKWKERGMGLKVDWGQIQCSVHRWTTSCLNESIEKSSATEPGWSG